MKSIDRRTKAEFSNSAQDLNTGLNLKSIWRAFTSKFVSEKTPPSKIRQAFRILYRTYPKYKHLIVEHPTKSEFVKAWKKVFGCDPSECKVEFFNQELNIGFMVQTEGQSHVHGGFVEHTEDPDLKDEERDFYYSGCGCTWSVDKNGVRYYLIDPKTNLPVYWDEVCAVEIIKRFINDALLEKENNAISDFMRLTAS